MQLSLTHPLPRTTVMGECLIHTLATTFKPEIMTSVVLEAWKDTYNALASDMIRAQVQANNRKSNRY